MQDFYQRRLLSYNTLLNRNALDAYWQKPDTQHNISSNTKRQPQYILLNFIYIYVDRLD